MITIEFDEPEESAATTAGVPEHARGDANAIAAVEAALNDLLAAALPAAPAGKPGDSPTPSPPRTAKRGRGRGSRSRFVMRRGVALREAILLAFAGILSNARTAARRTATAPVEAVHEYRKSVRRARALVSLLRPALGRTAARGLAAELRDAFRATGSIRDEAILLSTLRSISAEDPARLEIETTLAAEQEAAFDPARAAQCLAGGVRIVAPLPTVLRVLLPREFSLADLETGLARSDRRVQGTLARAATSGLETDFHQWRKRVKELRYQVELLGSTGSRELARREKELSDLAQELGRVTDLIVLGAELGRRQQAGNLPDAPGLLDNIHQSVRDRSRELVARGQQLFREAPKDFARQVLAERG